MNRTSKLDNRDRLLDTIRLKWVLPGQGTAWVDRYNVIQTISAADRWTTSAELGTRGVVDGEDGRRWLRSSAQRHSPRRRASMADSQHEHNPRQLDVPCVYNVSVDSHWTAHVPESLRRADIWICYASSRNYNIWQGRQLINLSGVGWGGYILNSLFISVIGSGFSVFQVVSD